MLFVNESFVLRSPSGDIQEAAACGSMKQLDFEEYSVNNVTEVCPVVPWTCVLLQQCLGRIDPEIPLFSLSSHPPTYFLVAIRTIFSAILGL